MEQTVRAIRQVEYKPTGPNYAINPSAWVAPGLPPLTQNQVTAYQVIANNTVQSCGFYVKQNHATLPVGIKVAVFQQDPPPLPFEPAGEFNLFNIQFATYQQRPRTSVAGGVTLGSIPGSALVATQFVPLELLDNWERSANILTKFAQKQYFVPCGPVSNLAGAVFPLPFVSETLPSYIGTPIPLLRGIYLLNVEIQ